MTSEGYFLRNELSEKNLFIKMILNKPELVNCDKHTLCYCKFISQNKNINKTVTRFVRKVDLTATEKLSSFRERQPDRNKKEIRKMQKLQDTLVELENISADVD